MKKINIISFILLLISAMLLLLWRFVITVPDIVIEINGIITLIAVFFYVFSTVRININKNNQNTI